MGAVKNYYFDEICAAAEDDLADYEFDAEVEKEMAQEDLKNAVDRLITCASLDDIERMVMAEFIRINQRKASGNG